MRYGQGPGDEQGYHTDPRNPLGTAPQTPLGNGPQTPLGTGPAPQAGPPVPRRAISSRPQNAVSSGPQPSPGYDQAASGAHPAYDSADGSQAAWPGVDDQPGFSSQQTSNHDYGSASYSQQGYDQ